jgi:hypothetical protein
MRVEYVRGAVAEGVVATTDGHPGGIGPILELSTRWVRCLDATLLHPYIRPFGDVGSQHG